MEEFELDSQQDAINEINKGGYKVYTTIDRKMQDYVVEKFKDANNLFNVSYVTRYCDTDNDGKTEEYIPHAAFVAMNYDGSIRATVGQWGEKKGSLVTNYAETDRRPIGSTVKPITPHAKCPYPRQYGNQNLQRIYACPRPGRKRLGDNGV